MDTFAGRLAGRLPSPGRLRTPPSPAQRGTCLACHVAGGDGGRAGEAGGDGFDQVEALLFGGNHDGAQSLPGLLAGQCFVAAGKFAVDHCLTQVPFSPVVGRLYFRNPEKPNLHTKDDAKHVPGVSRRFGRHYQKARRLLVRRALPENAAWFGRQYGKARRRFYTTHNRDVVVHLSIISDGDRFLSATATDLVVQTEPGAHVPGSPGEAYASLLGWLLPGLGLQNVGRRGLLQGFAWIGQAIPASGS